MLASPQDHSVDRILVHLKKPSGGSHANPFGRMMNDLSDCFGRQMQSKEGTGPRGGKALAAGTAVKQIAGFVFAVFAAHGNVTLTAQTIIFGVAQK
jgi:hypothetical protein